jgi:hypothetical protein
VEYKMLNVIQQWKVRQVEWGQVATSTSISPAMRNGTKGESNIAARSRAIAESGNCKHKSLPNTTPATKNEIPRTTDPHQTLHLPHKTTCHASGAL